MHEHIYIYIYALYRNLRGCEDTLQTMDSYSSPSTIE